MITERRIFQAKTGEAAAVLAKLKEAQPILDKLGNPISRIYTDFYSGPTDRVVWELDHQNLGRLESFEQEISQSAESLKFFEGRFEGLAQLIEGAAPELWRPEV